MNEWKLEQVMGEIDNCQLCKLRISSVPKLTCCCSFIHNPPPSLGLKPPLQRGRLRVFVAASAAEVRGRRALSKQQANTLQEWLTASCQLIGPGYPLTCTRFVCPAHRVSRQNGIFSRSLLSLRRVWCLRIAADLYSGCRLREVKESSGMWTCLH